MKLFNLWHDIFSEMAAEPKCKTKADRLAEILPPNKRDASKAIKVFWSKLLGTKFGWRTEEPPRIMEEIINVKQVELINGEKVPFLEWYAVVTFSPRKTVNITMILTSLDEPGAYRMDFILPGAKKSLVKQIREKVTIEVQKMEDKVTTTLEGEDLANLKRIRTSIKKVPHTHKPGIRQDDMLIARLNLDDIPLPYLHERADQIKKIIFKIGEIATEDQLDIELPNRKKKKDGSEEPPLMNNL
jgi:hypothetical protein